MFYKTIQNTFSYRSLLKRGDSMGGFDCIFIIIFITYTRQGAVRADLEPTHSYL